VLPVRQHSIRRADSRTSRRSREAWRPGKRQDTRWRRPRAAARLRRRWLRNVAGKSAIKIRKFLYTVSLMHCMTVSLANGGAGLGTMWGEPLARRMFREAGFDGVEVKHVAGDPTDIYYILRK
jgi:hypothetical protein